MPINADDLVHAATYTLPVASLRFVAVAEEPVELPPYIGSTLRGAFGHALREVTCLHKVQGAPCESCVENREPMVEGRSTRCVYGYIFDTPRPPDAPLHERQQEVPHPYVIRPADLGGGGGAYPPGASISYEVQLFGRAVQYVEPVVEACGLMAQRGLGAGRGAAQVREVWEQDPLGEERRLLPSRPALSDLTLVARWADAEARARALASGSIALQFLTPTRLVREHRPVDRPHFAALARALLRRLTALALFHGGEAPTDLFVALARRADDVRLAAWQGEWRDWERYSARQDRRMTFGGLVGIAVYEGDVAPFLPYLVYGQATHVGKLCTFGGGRYRIIGAGMDGV